MIQLLRNLSLTAATVRDHLSDDPALLALQISRRLPGALVGPTARCAAAIADRTGLAVGSVLTAVVLGRGQRVGELLEAALHQAELPPARARALADLALHAGHSDAADALLNRAAGAPGFRGALARHHWHDGAATAAVDVLSSATTRAERLQADRLEAELRVLSGWRPILAPEPYEPQPRRVLHVLTNSLPHTASGYAQRTHSSLLAQRAAGWEPLAVTRVGYPVQIGRLSARGEDVVDGVVYRRILPARLERGLDGRLQQQTQAVLRLALEFRPAVLHTTSHFVNAVVTRAVAAALGIPWVYEVRGQLADTWAAERRPEARSSERYRLFREREAEAARSADLVVTLGAAMKSNLLGDGVAEKDILIAPNGVGGEYAEEPLSPRQARHVLGLAPDRLLIGTVSSLVGYEGLDDLISAFGELAAQHPDVDLLIVGDGAELPALREQVAAAGLDRRVIFTGRVPREDAPRHHQALDVFVVPRKNLAVTRDVTPLKPVEAMASARPVVASRLPALAEIVEDGVTGLLTTPSDPHALASALRLLLGSRTLRERMGREGRIRVLEQRTWAANARALCQDYSRLRKETS